MDACPFLLEPRFVGRVWGFDDLRPWFDHSRHGGEPLGEVWLTGDDCRIASGPQQGKALAAVFSEAPEAMLGPAAPRAESPLLIKVIFAREKLSVQVHPDDTMARKYGQPRGKTECWYALASEPGAQVAAGLKSGVTMDQVRAGIHDGTLEQSLNLLPVDKGEMIYVDAGTVHAIWPGSILLETQQNSDTTYRMYDYGRPRELHIERSLEAARLTTRAGKIPPIDRGDRILLIDVEYFRVERIPVQAARNSASLAASDEPGPGLAYLFAAAGSARIAGTVFDPIELPPRGIVCVPAASPAFQVEDLGGLDLIRISPRWPASAEA
ncbi:MAG TPA: type I phosphomannose isomerase catalytic subunit [Candidatus Sulfopaludibacter sp.]|jgi:mannose-6-phosphate isomerase|nr:type I phosphomannose isomerase catalytic subunit [Candidatus Sulfopaludibacter sp.]